MISDEIKGVMQYGPLTVHILIAQLYNSVGRSWLWLATATKLSPEHVIGILGGALVKGINEQDVIAIAKMVCAGAAIVCPLVQGK